MQFPRKMLTRLCFVFSSGNRLQASDLGIALEHFKAHPYFMDSVMDGFELGGLVHHKFGCRDLAAIVQPGCHVHRFAILVTQVELSERT